jgi:hypothetical protein
MSGKTGTIDIDFMIVDETTRSKIIETGKAVEVVGEKLIIPSVEHLIALKLHAMKNNFKNRMLKDLPDVINLIKANNIDFKSSEFKSLCLKYGTEDIYKSILGFL